MVAAADAIFARVEADQRAVADAFRLGYQTGHADGYVAGEKDDSWWWCWTLGIAKRHAKMVPHNELCRRRAEDPTDGCPTRCGKCSACVRAHAWQANGQADYLGDGGR